MAVAVTHASFPRRVLLVLACLVAAVCTSCATFEGMLSDDAFHRVPPAPDAQAQERRAPEQPAQPAPPAQPLSRDEKAVLASAQTLIGQRPESKVNVNGRTFVLDCIGTVGAIFYEMNIDVQKDFRRYPGDGVNRLYQTLKALDTLNKNLYPRPGDVIFWDNTWDANGDGILTDDPRTHAGIVLSVDEDGTIHYVHEHIIKGVTVEAMNLLHPHDYYDPQGRIINNALAMNSGISRKDNPPHWTSGDLWDSFGDILRVRRHFEVADAPSDAGPSDEVLLAMRPPDQW